MTQFLEVDSVVLVDVGRRQRRLDADDLVSLDVELVQQGVVALPSQRTATRLRGLVVERRSSADVLSLFCARPAADG